MRASASHPAAGLPSHQGRVPRRLFSVPVPAPGAWQPTGDRQPEKVS